MKNFVLGLLLLAVNLIPLLFIPYFYLLYEFPKLMAFSLIGVLLIGCIYYYLSQQKSIVLPNKKFLIIIGFYIFFYAVSTLFSISPSVSLMGLREVYSGGFVYLLFLLIYFYAAFLLQKEKITIIKSIVWAGAAASCFYIFNYSIHLFKFQDWFFRGPGTIGHPVRLAFYLLPVIPLSFSLYLSQEKKFLRFFYAFCTLLVFLAFCLTFTRSFLLLFIFIALIIGYVFRKIIIKVKPILFVVILSAIIIPFTFISLNRLPFSKTEFIKSSLNTRWSEWITVVKDLKNRSIPRLFIGNGPDTSSFIKNFQTEKEVGLALEVRNYYLNILSIVGIIGLIIYLFFLFFILNDAKKNAEKDWLSKGIYLSLLTIIISSFFYYQTENILLIFWLLAGLSIKNNFIINNQRLFKPVIKVAVVIFLIICLFIWTRFLLAEIIFDSNYSSSNIEKAISLNPFNDFYYYQLSINYSNQSINTMKVDFPLAEKYYYLAIKNAHHAQRLVPVNSLYINNLVSLYYWGGVKINKKLHQQALYWANYQLSISDNYSIANQIGLIYLDLGQLDKALEYFYHARLLSPNMPGVYLHIGEALKQQGKFSQALYQYQKALKLYPQWDLAIKEIEKINQLIKTH